MWFGRKSVGYAALSLLPSFTQIYSASAETLNVGVVRFQTSPRVCFNAFGWHPGDAVSMTVAGLPNQNTKNFPLGHANRQGYLFWQWDSLYTQCTGNQGEVTFTAVDGANGHRVVTTVPGSVFCQGATGATFNNRSNSQCDKNPPSPATSTHPEPMKKR